MDQLTENRILKLLQETKLSHTEIGQRFNLSRGPVAYIKKKYNVIRPNIRITRNRFCLTCKKEFLAKSLTSQRPNRGKYCSKKCYQLWQISDANRGANHPNWRQHANHENEIHRLRHSKKWKNWREQVFKRDQYTCQFCHKNGYIEPHHIYPRRDFPEKIFDINNGISLCRPCHQKTINKEYKYIERCVKIIKLNEAALMHDGAVSTGLQGRF